MKKIAKKVSDETKAKISAAQKGKKHTEATKAKISAALFGNNNGEKKDDVSIRIPLSLLNTAKDLAEKTNTSYKTVLLDAIVKGLDAA